MHLSARLILYGFLAAFAFSQESTIRVASDLVLTPVWVSDSAGRPVRDLSIDDFEIEENGVRVAPARIGGPGEAPLDIALLFDLSGSVYPRFDLERQSAISFLKRIMRPFDSGFIVSVANEPKIVQERTSSQDTILGAIAAITPTTQATAFNNSVIRAVQLLGMNDRTDVRHVMVALSDGEDNRSIGNKQEDVLRAVQSSNVIFYSINPSGPGYSKSLFGRRAQANMESLAQQTGGAAFVADRIEDLSVFYDRIANELQSQYLLGYYAPSSGSLYRKISIRVHERPDLLVKARAGYYRR